MKVFISHSQEDKQLAFLISDRLRKADHEVWYDGWSLRAGDNILETVNEGLKGADAVIVIVSKQSLRSKWVMREVSAVALGEISGKSCRIIPVLVDNSPVPQYLARYVCFDLTHDTEVELKHLLHALSEKPATKPPVSPYGKRSYEAEVRKIVNALDDGRLTLVCGAGASIDAGIPSWDQLLQRLLATTMKRLSQGLSIAVDELTPSKFLKLYAPPALVLGKYLKSNLGKDFLPELRNALYAGNPTSCAIIDAIADLARPRRDRKSLESIITFNFDGLVEESLERTQIRYKSVSAEGTRCRAKELPIYHVHGFLPRRGTIEKEADIVFSEDAYHTLFIDPFSWSNLIQLSKLSQNTCLFIGLSLADPNLRRLLDVARRKNPSQSLEHFIVRTVPNLSGDNAAADQLAFFLQEQDAHGLGLNVIWVDDYPEIAPLLRGIVGDEA